MIIRLYEIDICLFYGHHVENNHGRVNALTVIPEIVCFHLVNENSEWANALRLMREGYVYKCTKVARYII